MVLSSWVKACSTQATPIGAMAAVSMATNARPINPGATAYAVSNGCGNVVMMRGSFMYVPTFNNSPFTSSLHAFTQTAVVRLRYGSLVCQGLTFTRVQGQVWPERRRPRRSLLR